MKKLVFAAAVLLGLSSFAAPPTDVNAKVLKAFNETFAHARDVQWNESGNQYQVYFVQNDIKNRVLYDAAGNMLQSIRYYSEQNLPLNVLSQIKKTQDGKRIFGVTELATTETIRYEVVLEDAKNWTVVEADAYGSLIQKKKYRKA